MGLVYIINAPKESFYCCKVCETPVANMYAMKTPAFSCDTRKLFYKFTEIINTILENNFIIRINYKSFNTKGIYCKSCNYMIGYHIDTETHFLIKDKLI